MASVEGNVILAVSHLAPRLGEIVEGLSFEGTNCACSAGVIHAGTAMNVVPRHAVLRGTLERSPPNNTSRRWSAFVRCCMKWKRCSWSSAHLISLASHRPS